MPLVGTGFADDIENIASGAILGGEGRRNDADFRDGFGDLVVNIRAVRQPDRASIDQVAGVVGEGSVDRHGHAGIR